MFSRALVILSIVGLSACSAIPDPIQVADDTSLVGYNKAVISSQETVGETARWGGVITQVENKPNQTVIEVVHFPLNHYGKPITSQDTVGRFKAVIDSFVDPIAFEEGRLITFIGKVNPPMAGLVGEHPYMFPALAVENFHLWRVQSNYPRTSLYFDFYGGWHSPFYYPYWRNWGMFYPRVTVVHNSRHRDTNVIKLRGKSQRDNASRSSGHTSKRSYSGASDRSSSAKLQRRH